MELVGEYKFNLDHDHSYFGKEKKDIKESQGNVKRIQNSLTDFKWLSEEQPQYQSKYYDTIVHCKTPLSPHKYTDYTRDYTHRHRDRERAWVQQTHKVLGSLSIPQIIS